MNNYPGQSPSSSLQSSDVIYFVRVALTTVSGVSLLAVFIVASYWFIKWYHRKGSQNNDCVTQADAVVAETRQASFRTRVIQLIKPSPKLQAFTGTRRRNRASTLDSDSSFVVGHPSCLSLANPPTSTAPPLRSDDPFLTPQTAMCHSRPAARPAYHLPQTPLLGGSPVYTPSSVGCDPPNPSHSSPRLVSDSSFYQDNKVIRKPPQAVLSPKLPYIRPDCPEEPSGALKKGDLVTSYWFFSSESESDPTNPLTQAAVSSTPLGASSLLKQQEPTFPQTASERSLDSMLVEVESCSESSHAPSYGTDVDCSLSVEAESTSHTSDSHSYHTAPNESHNQADAITSNKLGSGTTVSAVPNVSSFAGMAGEAKEGFSPNSEMKKVLAFDYFRSGDILSPRSSFLPLPTLPSSPSAPLTSTPVKPNKATVGAPDMDLSFNLLIHPPSVASLSASLLSPDGSMLTPSPTLSAQSHTRTEGQRSTESSSAPSPRRQKNTTIDLETLRSFFDDSSSVGSDDGSAESVSSNSSGDSITRQVDDLLQELVEWYSTSRSRSPHEILMLASGSGSVCSAEDINRILDQSDVQDWLGVRIGKEHGDGNEIDQGYGHGHGNGNDKEDSMYLSDFSSFLMDYGYKRCSTPDNTKSIATTPEKSTLKASISASASSSDEGLPYAHDHEDKNDKPQSESTPLTDVSLSLSSVMVDDGKANMKDTGLRGKRVRPRPFREVQNDNGPAQVQSEGYEVPKREPFGKSRVNNISSAANGKEKTKDKGKGKERKWEEKENVMFQFQSQSQSVSVAAKPRIALFQDRVNMDDTRRISSSASHGSIATKSSESELGSCEGYGAYIYTDTDRNALKMFMSGVERQMADKARNAKFSGGYKGGVRKTASLAYLRALNGENDVSVV
ncbi:hypothetical protein D9758_008063 [Tetrapyrgos nigripes]|uniref:Uncharacterized protein n=1 Tax=Tetrapyrgos nigripes TaxID=182062 RepID=A0A8H5FW98_9AGAR|nr:hypothetical protein D9758_008063 [Tetrapyrgos nigripes]